MNNLYKRSDVFSCIHESHRGYKNKISVYHILRVKLCYPDGCMYFRWRCKQLNKKSKCHRGFKYIGRNCFGCKDFYEEKIHNYPELRISREEYQFFLRELEIFEEWLEELSNKHIEIAGVVKEVKPHFTQKVFPKAKFLSFKGYLLVFDSIYLDRYHFEDNVYSLMSSEHYNRFRIGPGDKLEAKALLKLNNGRIILHRFRDIEILERGREPFWNEQSITIARETATEFPDQPEGCIQCGFGALVDVEYFRDKRSYKRRRMICLKGMLDHKGCYIKSEYCGLDAEANAVTDEKCEKQGKIYFHG